MECCYIIVVNFMDMMNDLGHHPKRLLLGGVVKILIYPRPSSCLADVGLFDRPKSQQSPSNKESSYKLNFLHNGRSNTRSRSNSSLCGADTPYVKYQL